MNINNNQKSKKIRVLLLFATLFILLLIGAYYTYHNYSKKTAGNNPATSTKFSAAPVADNNPNDVRKNSNTQATTLNNNGSQTSNSNDFSVSINPVVSSTNIHIGTLVNGATNGSCILSASQDGKAVIQLRTSNVRANVNNYDCGIFNIPISEFPSTGSWQLNLSVTSNGNTASVKRNINI